MDAQMKREMHEIRSSINESTAIKIDIGNSLLPVKKRIVEVKMLLSDIPTWIRCGKLHPLDLSIFSGEAYPASRG